MDDKFTYQVVLDNFKNLLQAEVIGRLQAPILTAPGQRLAILAVRLELQ